MTLPTFVVPGVAKSGTTSLWYYLSQHPDVFVCTPKEPNHFVADLMTPGKAVASRSEYLGLFERGRSAEALGDISPAYLSHHEVAPTRIRAAIPDCKIMILLRSPIERAYSRYWAHFVRDKGESRPFDEIAPEIRHAEIVAPGIRHFLEAFGKEHVLITLTDDMRTDKEAFLRSIWDYLGVRHVELQRDPTMNRSGPIRSRWLEFFLKIPQRTPRPLKQLLRRLPRTIRNDMFTAIRNLNTKSKPEMKPEVRDRLRDFFSAEIRELQELTGRDLVSLWLE